MIECEKNVWRFFPFPRLIPSAHDSSVGWVPKGAGAVCRKEAQKNHLKCEKRWREALKWSEQEGSEKKLPCFNANTCVSCDCVGSHIASSVVGIWQFLCKYFLPLFPHPSRSRPSSHTSAWKRKSIQNSVLALVSTTSQFAFSSIAFNFFRVCSFSLSGSWRRRTGWSGGMRTTRLVVCALSCECEY